MLEFQHVPIKLTGIDSKTDDKNSIAGTFVTAENIEMHKTGKVQSRSGYAFPASPITHTSEIIGTAPYGDSQMCIERDGNYYFDESKGLSLLNDSAYTMPTMGFESAQNAITINSPWGSSNRNLISSSSSCGDTYGLALWTYFDTPYYYSNWVRYRLGSKVAEIYSADATYATYGFGLSTLPKSIGGRYFIYTIGTAISIVDTSTTTTYTTSALGTIPGAVINAFDATESANYVALVVHNYTNKITTIVLFEKATHTFTYLNVDVVGQYDVVGIGFNAAGTEIIASANLYSAATTVKAYIVAMPLVLTYSYAVPINLLAATARRASLYIIDANTCVGIFQRVNGTNTIFGVAVIYFNRVTGAPAGYFELDNHILSTKINYPYFITTNQADVLNCSYFLMHTSLATRTPKIVSSFYYGEAIPYSLFTYLDLSHFSSNYLPMDSVKPLSDLSLTNRQFSIAYNYMQYDITSNEASIVNWNGSLITNAWGNLRVIDSIKSTAPLFASWPISGSPLALTSTASGTGLPDGAYNYVALYTAYDNNNNVIYSSPLYASSITLSGGPKYITIIFTDTSGLAISRSTITLYRTEMNGSIFYYLTNLTASASFNDNIPDTNLIKNRVLYTTGDIVDSSPSPCAKFLTVAKSRMWLIAPENNDELYFSKKTYPGEAPQFNSIYRMLVQNIGGDLEAIAEMDDKLIIFRRNAVFVSYGDGPDELGNGSFADPQLVTMSLGCKYPRSIVLNDKGLFFMSYEGIYLITRGLTVEYVGAAVEKYNNLTITQALNLVDRHQLWFHSAQGTTLVYDDYFGTWYTFTNQPTYAASMLNTGTPYHYRALYAVKYPGRLMIEVDSTYYDGAPDNPFPVTIESGWLSLAGIQGFQRLRTFTFVGDLNDTMALTLYHDFETISSEIFSVSSATVGTTPAQYQVKPIRQKCESMKYKIVLSSLSGSFNLSSMGIEAGLKRGTIRFDRSKRVSS